MPPRVPPPFVDQNAIHDSPPPSKKEISKTMDNVPRVSIRKKNDTPAGWFGVNCQSQVGIHPPLSDNWRNRFESTSGGDRKGWPQSSPLIQSKTSTSPWPQTKDWWWRIVYPGMHPPPPFPRLGAWWKIYGDKLDVFFGGCFFNIMICKCASSPRPSPTPQPLPNHPSLSKLSPKPCWHP